MIQNFHQQLIWECKNASESLEGVLGLVGNPVKLDGLLWPLETESFVPAGIAGVAQDGVVDGGEVRG